MKTKPLRDGILHYEPNDEIVGRGPFHIEGMSDSLFWISLAGRVFYIGAKNGRAHLTLWDEESGKKAVEDSCRPPPKPARSRAGKKGG